ncbi:uncharacterized protein LOC142985593 [Anticarsia gemmatalis]|uniref:uncharacterized protein LOC142985593 n=1 Tax=Anticarsia gemmatalis TaxID=129554 RepID=UPI003F75F377
MWSSNAQSTTIPPNLLKNFDPYEILEPQKFGGNSDGPKVDRLIDLDDLPPQSGINASLLDQKTEYSYLDLYENMYVTPQLVKRKETPNTVPNNIDFKDFFDKCENGEKVDWTKDVITKKEISQDSAEITKKPKVLVSKVTVEEDPEELIYEVLTMKSKEKQILDELNRNEKLTKIDTDRLQFPRLKVLNTPNIDINALKKKSETVKPSTSKKEPEFDFANEFSRLKLNNTTKNTQSNVTNVPQNSKIDGQIYNTSNFQVIAIKKDEKAYRKKRVIRPEKETTNYTKGADFYEKSIVLPQIMSRIFARQDYLHDLSMLKRRLILDSGSNNDNIPKCSVNDSKKCENKSNIGSKTTISDDKKTTSASGRNATVNTENCSADSFGKLNPIVLMEDCNKERLRAWTQSRMFKNFVLNGNK